MHVAETVQRTSFSGLPNVVLVPRLRALRLEQALTQDDLAERAGVARSTVLKAEAGHELRPSTVRKLARALGVRPIRLQR